VFGHPHHRPPFARHRWQEPSADPADWPFHGFGRRWGGFVSPRDRVFGRGDLKYVVLDLLKDQPRHGYDVIRALEERFRGFYRPSPGSIYPTLQLLEDLGYVTASEQEGKRVYAITDAGRRFLAEQQAAVDDIRGRLRRDWAPERAELWELMHELRELARSLLRLRRGPRGGGPLDPERVRRLREIVARTRREVEALFDERPSSESGTIL
jgi:DNA-binding PadR family transcriptional regulator